MSKVSIIVPNYNHAAFLPQRLESIFNQTFQDFEVILLDDCSTDNSIEILNKYGQNSKVTHYEINKKNSGSTFKQWKKGIDLANGEYIWIAESDDVAELNFLDSLIPIFINNPNVGITYSQSRIINENNLIIGNWSKQTDLFQCSPWLNNFVLPGYEIIENYLVYQNIIPNASAVVFRKANYLISSGINTKLTINGDWLLWIKILKDCDLAFINQNLNNCRFHSQKGSTKNINNFNNIKEFYQVIRLVFSIIKFTKNKKNEILQNVFDLWKKQEKDLQMKFFFKIFVEAIKIDKKLIKRIISNRVNNLINRMANRS